MSAFNWTCSYCNRDQIVTAETCDEGITQFSIGATRHGAVGIQHIAIRCANADCNEVTLIVQFGNVAFNKYTARLEFSQIDQEKWPLRPMSRSVPLPDYIPAPLREDYYEACLILNHSPKASATLARRCLQGMIRDFCGISKARLIDEISQLKERAEAGNAPRGVDLEAIDAIDAVRSVGNIGAHMEKDINVIIDVDPGEAQALIHLIEMLFKDWYVARHDRQQRLAKVVEIAAQKDEAKKGTPSS